MSTAQRGFRIEGRVQGVGFRWWTRRAAARIGVEGSVRNLVDGAVQVEASGALEALAELEDALRRGPPGCRVDRLVAIEPDPAASVGPFRIER